MAGLFYEQLTVGMTFEHAIHRTLTEMDNVLFTAMTHNPAALHLDEEYCRINTEGFNQNDVLCATFKMLKEGA
jgi:acyl dehydratase